MASSLIPLRDRTFRCTVRPSVLLSNYDRAPHYKQWDEETMKRAYASVKENKLSVRKASSMYNIPKSTLGDRVTGRVTFGSHSGPTRYLSDAEEAQLVQFLCNTASLGYARTKKEVLAIVEELVSAKGKEVHVSNGWWESFRRRHPILTLSSAEKLSYARLVATNPHILSSYFDLLEQTLTEYDLFTSPARIFNCDETGLPFEHTPPHVIGIKGQKHPRAVTTGSKKNITVLACCSASGSVLPPLVIYRRKALNRGLVEGEVPETSYALSDRGWMDHEIFENWFTQHFLIHAPPARPLLLLLDGHSTHYHPGFIRKAAHEQVVVFCLPPNTTHLLQPLDKGAFGPLKTYWNQECQKFLRENPGQVMTDYSFMKVFSKAWYQAMTIPNVMAAFRTTGIYPFCPTKVSATDTTNKCDELLKDIGLPFLPALSPARTPHRSFSRAYQYQDLSFQGDSSPDCSPEVPSNLLLGFQQPKESLISKFFPSIPDTQKPLSYEKTCAKVLTSAEYVNKLEEKEKLKREKEEEKERRKQERETKKMEKEREKELKKTKKGATKRGKKKVEEDIDIGK